MSKSILYSHWNNSAQKTAKKHQIFQKRDVVENRPSCKVYSLCMGYSLLKIPNLGQNFKLPKICQNRFCIHIGVILRKNPLKKTKYSRNETMLKIGHLVKSKAFAWPIAFAKYSIWATILNFLIYAKIDSVFTLQ